MFVFKAAVVGAGTMGGQIAQTIASAGIPVVLKDVEGDLVEAGLAEARKVTQSQTSKLVERGKLNEEAAGTQVAGVLDRIHGTTEYEGFGDVDFVVEAVPERMEIKQAVFGELDAVTPGHAILASNTSSLSITEIGEATSRPHLVCGFHYFYPASVMRLIEVIESDDTAPETTQAAVAFAQAIRKMPITCAEVPGFVVNRVLNSAMGEVWRLQEEQQLSIKRSPAPSPRPAPRRWGRSTSATFSASTRSSTSPSTWTPPTPGACTSTAACASSSAPASSGRRAAAAASTRTARRSSRATTT